MKSNIDRPKVEDIHQKSLSGISRRKLLKNLSIVGFGLPTALHITSEDVLAADQDEVPIVYAFTREDKEDPTSITPRKKMVPADWYNDLQHAFNVHDRTNFTQIDGVMASWVSPGEYGGIKSNLEVDILDEKARDKIPEEVNGVPVEVNKVAGYSVGNCNEGHFSDSTPGSIKCSSPDGWGTLAPRLFGPNGNEWFATAAHLYGGDEAKSGPLYQPTDSYPKIGDVTYTYCYEDFIVAEPKNNHTPASHIEDGGPVIGHYSKDGLSDLKAQNEPLEKIGVKTCHTQGQIQAVDGTTCAYGCTCKSGQLKWGSESDMGDGDSGSVNYHPWDLDPDDLVVGGFNNARTWWIGEDYVWGTAAHHIYDKWGYYF